MVIYDALMRHSNATIGYLSYSEAAFCVLTCCFSIALLCIIIIGWLYNCSLCTVILSVRINKETYGLEVTCLGRHPSRITVYSYVHSADGRFVVEKLSTRATVYYNGTVIWKPPTIYRSLCSINVEYFPFDEQKCYLKLGSWTYHGRLVNIRHHSLSSANEDEVGKKIRIIFLPNWNMNFFY